MYYLAAYGLPYKVLPLAFRKVYSLFNVPAKAITSPWSVLQTLRLDMNHCHEIGKAKPKQMDAFKICNLFSPFWKTYPLSDSSPVCTTHSHFGASQRQQSSYTVIWQTSPQLQKHVSICDEVRAEQHPPLMCTFHTSPRFVDCYRTDTESLKHCECVKWVRWTKSDLIYTWRKEA